MLNFIESSSNYCNGSSSYANTIKMEQNEEPSGYYYEEQMQYENQIYIQQNNNIGTKATSIDGQIVNRGGRKQVKIGTTKRNARERNRVRYINTCFDLLREHIPVHNENSASSQRKLSKVETLKYASQYIKQLTMLLQQSDDSTSSFNDDRLINTSPNDDYLSPSSSPLSSSFDSYTPTQTETTPITTAPTTNCNNFWSNNQTSINNCNNQYFNNYSQPQQQQQFTLPSTASTTTTIPTTGAPTMTTAHFTNNYFPTVSLNSININIYDCHSNCFNNMQQQHQQHAIVPMNTNANEQNNNENVSISSPSSCASAAYSSSSSCYSPTYSNQNFNYCKW